MTLPRPTACSCSGVACGLLVGLSFAARAHADVGDATDGLPGIVHVPVAVAATSSLAVAGSAGYGWTEGVLHEGDSHSRVFGSLAASFQPTSFLAAALRFDGRYDKDTGPEPATQEVGDPRLLVRAFGAVGGRLHLGAQVGVWFPGSVAPSFVAAAITPDASLLASYAAEGSPLTLTSRAGFRWDNSAKSAPDAGRLSAPERLELGLDQASAVLLGVGGALRVAPRVELLADATWDLLVGTGAPTALQGPILASVGGRYTVDGDGKLQLQAVLTASPSDRPALSSTSPLVDVQPRVSGLFALVWRPFARRIEPPAAPVAPSAPSPTPPPAPVASERQKLQGRVVAEDGRAPIAHAHVVVTPAASGASKETETDEDGHFEIDALDPGEVTVAISGKGIVPLSRKVRLSGTPAPIDVSVVRALAGSEVRGVVRNFKGEPVVASVKLEPSGVDVPVGANGTFHVDVEPGSYTVLIHADGYLDQRRQVVVGRNGVTMLDVELRTQTK